MPISFLIAVLADFGCARIDVMKDSESIVAWSGRQEVQLGVSMTSYEGREGRKILVDGVVETEFGYVIYRFLLPCANLRD